MRVDLSRRSGKFLWASERKVERVNNESCAADSAQRKPKHFPPHHLAFSVVCFHALGPFEESNQILMEMLEINVRRPNDNHTLTARRLIALSRITPPPRGQRQTELSFPRRARLNSVQMSLRYDDASAEEESTFGQLDEDVLFIH
jgi:hypothetical protein